MFVDVISTYTRSRFYGKLAPANKDNALVMPAHTVPFDIFTVGKQGGKQSSLITIMSLWNTMMGTSWPLAVNVIEHGAVRESACGWTYVPRHLAVSRCIFSKSCGFATNPCPELDAY